VLFINYYYGYIIHKDETGRSCIRNGKHSSSNVYSGNLKGRDNFGNFGVGVRIISD
jgi:hypothetical protein